MVHSSDLFWNRERVDLGIGRHVKLLFCNLHFEPMTTPPSSPPKPADPSPYSSLRATPSDDQPPNLRPPNVTSPASPNGFSIELAKLQELREALWEAFKAGPDAGLPTILIELTNCYTNTLRFQMNMKSLHSRKHAPQPPPQQVPSAKKQG